MAQNQQPNLTGNTSPIAEQENDSSEESFKNRITAYIDGYWVRTPRFYISIILLIFTVVLLLLSVNIRTNFFTIHLFPPLSRFIPPLSVTIWTLLLITLLVGLVGIIVEFLSEYSSRIVKYIISSAILLSIIVLLVSRGVGPFQIDALAIGPINLGPFEVSFQHLAILLFVLASAGLFTCRLNHLQQQYLDRIEQERTEFAAYEKWIDQETENDEAERAESSSSNKASKREVSMRITTALTYLKRADRAVRQKNYTSFLESLYSANRQKIHVYSYFYPNSGAALARQISTAARYSLPEDRQKDVTSYLYDENNNLNDNRNNLFSALLTLQDWEVKQLDIRMQIKRYVQLIVIVLSLLLALLFFILGTVPDPGFPETLAFSTGAESTTNDLPDLTSPIYNDLFLLLVFLTGIVGAVVSLILFKDDSSSKNGFYEKPIIIYESIPDPTVRTEAVIARLLVGGISAFVIVVLFQAFNQELQNGWRTLLGIAFASGFSENILRDRLLPEEHEPDPSPEEPGANPSPDGPLSGSEQNIAEESKRDW